MKLNGLLLLNKPKNITSTACLNKIKYHFKIKKIGHGGTLDPLATGLLLVFIGQATKLSPFLMHNKKTYEGILELGKTSPSYDLGSEVSTSGSWENIDPKLIHKEIKAWELLTSQEVPPVSAAKYKGKPLYFHFRKGKDVPVKHKKINIFYAEVIKTELPYVHFKVSCSAGTYIRSLAHSLGKRLGCGAILVELKRTECTPFKLENAYSLAKVLEGDLNKFVLSIPEALFDWPQIKVNDYLARRLKNGAILDAREVSLPPKQGQRALFLTTKNEPIAIMECIDELNPKWKILRGLWN
ncbi:tRNA pseudouridine(55) synthase TruB [Desulfonauticus submarinus]|uniref:tRNA pseudouridine synthase B n=1 Tax=Desulfonauticus submarinus TaxID=206665 RepID=A0A1H0AL83_9BACT|nr:tRNA pseudouridine(55) synthase TruB [Desulfonauticus submarinus]SDN34169.1 tRNA pseudouridine55 synthase [Desulfonauticus submarinus]